MDNKDKVELANYRAADSAGLLVRLPVPLGTEVWEICSNPAWNPGVDSAESFLFGEVRTPRHIVQQTIFSIDMLEDWGIRIFLTKFEAEKMLQFQMKKLP